jgi:phosphatidate cytidylyltransferase
MLKQRLITAFCLLPLVVVVVWFDKPLPWLTIFAAIWGVLAALEFYRAVSASRQKALPLTAFGLILTLLFIIGRDSELLNILGKSFDTSLINPVLLAATLALPPVWLLLRRRGNIFNSWLWTVAGILYIGWLLSHLVALRGLDYGRDWVLFALFVTFASDSVAYFIGSAFGKHLLAPGISPKKTLEGAVGGIVGAIGIGLLLVLILDLPITYIQAIPLTIAISIFGQLGDLLESLFKRSTGVKDSGNAMPGHGGFLDRMDSVVFAGAFVYYYAAVLCNG